MSDARQPREEEGGRRHIKERRRDEVKGEGEEEESTRPVFRLRGEKMMTHGGESDLLEEKLKNEERCR